jgi:hypothetical protein
MTMTLAKRKELLKEASQTSPVAYIVFFGILGVVPARAATHV